jgi:threonine dehydrogenase-like Zn-dependent dehydrogenase
MKGTILHGPHDVRFEEVPEPKILKPTDAIIRLSATCICGSDLWPFRGLNEISEPMAMGHEYCGIVEEIGSAVKTVRPGQFRCRIVLHFRQHLSALPLWLPVIV